MTVAKFFSSSAFSPGGEPSLQSAGDVDSQRMAKLRLNLGQTMRICPVMPNHIHVFGGATCG